MSDPNQTYSPQPVGYVPIEYTPQRPTSVTVLAIIGIVLATLTLVICMPLAVVPFFIPAVTDQNPGVAAIKNNTALFAWTLAGAGIGMVTSILLLVASIGSLKLLAWARHGMIAYAVITILMTIVNTVIQFAFVFPITLSPSNLPPGAPPNTMGMIKAFTYGSTLVGVTIMLVLPVCILIFFRKAHVVDAFERRVTL